MKRKRLYKESIQLPQTLIKLSIFDLKLVGNPELFVQTINSHSSLKGFIFNSCDESSFLTPFFTRYPSLESFKYNNRKSKNHQHLIKVFESNPQILILKLDCSLLGSLASHIGLNLSNLKEFELSGSLNFVPDNAYVFSQTIKINKLKLTVRVLTSSLLNSLLQSCSELEEFIYEPGGLFSLKNMSVKVEKPTKIKKLRISKDIFDESSFNSIILNCPYLEDIDIVFPGKWEGYRDIISQRCANLKSLTLYNFIENVCHIEYTSLEFLSRNCSFKNTLTKLTLENFPFGAINSVHLQDYSNLKAIKFQSYHIDYEKNIDEVLSNNDLWPNCLKIPIRENKMYGKTFLKYI
ncbi:hypothetical protein CONCODRAFT_12508 [Conidiobolus coronatus NRRL 28638]|uniref:RNI-like protein n=1 Tax=Conidiobolus coronatus (strain ATCC 28846 / CBS 209.66 / NRRL 28638) TaxID=796925 RepID=A0A137NSQ5_CONC2|nr:hypothetical protein CONCODRAFT_12508 [Conidiobolus coronatus NRRL 28638]|eukprot:KXN65803.1 hypothetical protein CONCODRAFT_12508 [Conidiobolus coronatus NRRL 28638]